MRHGALKVTANMNAKAAGGVSEARRTFSSPVAIWPPEPTVAVNKVPAPKYKEPRTPSAASLLIIEAKYAKNVCHV